MKRQLLLWAAGLCAATALPAQVITPCLYDLAMHQWAQEYPGYQAALQRAIEAHLPETSAKNPEQVFTIPVVVHVVWREPAENIAQERIDAQIRVLNEVYRRHNADTVNTRTLFHPVVADAGIEFVLDRVIRVQTNEIFQPTFSLSGSTLPDKVKRTAQGGSDAVDPTNYLNLWICAIRPLNIFGQQSPVLGYAYPPAGLPNWPNGASAPSPELDGVVVDYRTVGDSLTYNAWGLNLPMRGRTVTHEVGHYLGLRHISGDGLSGLLGLPDCNADDGVADTPNQGRQSQFVCNPQQNTCNDGPGDLPDMIENYMDYSTETCQNAFTAGQVAIMRAVLTGPRADLPLAPNRIRERAQASLAQALIFPNPSAGLFQWRLPDDFGAYAFSVTDARGQLVVQPQQGQPHQSLDLSHLPPGLYFLQVRPTGQPGWTTKLIRQ